MRGRMVILAGKEAGMNLAFEETDRLFQTPGVIPTERLREIIEERQAMIDECVKRVEERSQGERAVVVTDSIRDAARAEYRRRTDPIGASIAEG